MKLRFEGYSDDSLYELSTGESYDNSASGEPIHFLVSSPSEGSLFVVGQYCPGPSSPRDLLVEALGLLGLPAEHA